MPKAGARGNLVFAAVSNPERRKILDHLRGGERSAGEIVSFFPDLPQPAISRHLRILREAGLVAAIPRAQQRIYLLNPAKLREVDAWISTYREFWSGRLDALSEHLGASEDVKGRRREEKR